MSNNQTPVTEPFPNSKVLSERMLNLAYLFDLMGQYSAEGSFKAMSVEVAALERQCRELREDMRRTILPDPHDERELSADWLKEKIQGWIDALTPVSDAEKGEKG